MYKTVSSLIVVWAVRWWTELLQRSEWSWSACLAGILGHRSPSSRVRRTTQLYRQRHSSGVRLLWRLARHQSTATTIKPCPHCRRKVRLSQISATVAENDETTAKFGDSRTFLRQCQFSATVAVFGDKLSYFSATVWIGFKRVRSTTCRPMSMRDRCENLLSRCRQNYCGLRRCFELLNFGL